MSQKRGFTLIELLVVISIIALLMSILMPALGAVKKKAKDVMCKSNLSQWGKVWGMYAADNDDKLFGNDGDDETWHDDLENYYKNKKLLLCPMAEKPHVSYSGVVSDAEERDPFACWVDDVNGDQKLNDPDDNWGSYGLNGMCTSGQDPVRSDNLPLATARKVIWRKISTKGSFQIPMMYDSASILHQGYAPNTMAPSRDDTPHPKYCQVEKNDNELQLACMPRHPKVTTNMLFMDFSVQGIKLADEEDGEWFSPIWRLRWHRDWYKDGGNGRFPPAGQPGYSIPDWMKSGKNG